MLTIFKFHSMYEDADDRLEELKPAGLIEADGPLFKMKKDPRVTSIGRFIRKHSINEFPQFLNVPREQMSILGPREITEYELEWYMLEQSEALLSVPVGITGLCQMGPGSEYDFASGKRQRLELSYVWDVGFGLDAKLHFKTLGTMLQETGY